MHDPEQGRGDGIYTAKNTTIADADADAVRGENPNQRHRGMFIFNFVLLRVCLS